MTARNATPTDYDLKVQAFAQAEELWKSELDRFLTGQYLADAVGRSFEEVRAIHTAAVAELERLREDRNFKLKEAQDAMRQAVVLSETQWRGPDGKADVVRSGPFSVSSVTKRGFDMQSLFDGCRRHGVYERLLDLKYLGKDGKEHHLVEQTWDYDYDGVMNWLRANQLDDVIDGAYDEKESTPQVKGPKPVAMIGDQLK